MRREFLIVGGAILLLIAVYGSFMVLNPQDSQVNNTTDNLDTPTNNTTNNTTAPPPQIFAPDDPGTHSYPRNPKSAQEDLINSKDLATHLTEQINQRRVQDNISQLYVSAPLLSNTRTHSWDMYNKSYFSETSPEGVTPVERYNGTATNCTMVEEYIFKQNYTVETADGVQPHVSSEGIAADIFSQMLNNETMMNTMLSDEYNSLGVGSYLAGEETDSGATKVIVHTTVDYCKAR